MEDEPDANLPETELIFDNASSQEFDDDMGGIYESSDGLKIMQAQILTRWLFVRLQGAYHISDACILRFIAAFLVVLFTVD